MATRYFGERIKRNEDPRLLMGQALFVDDVHLPGMAHVAFVRSPYAHARIVSIDVSSALQREGVIAVFTAADLGDYWKPGPLLVSPPPIKDIYFIERTQVPLVKDTVRHLGEAVVMVVAESRYIAEDALNDIMIDYEALPVVVDLEQALEPTAPLVHDDLTSNIAAHVIQHKGDYGSIVAKARSHHQAPLRLRSRHCSGDRESRHRRPMGSARAAPDSLGYDASAHPHPQRPRRHARSLGESGPRRCAVHRRRLWPQDHDVLS